MNCIHSRKISLISTTHFTIGSIVWKIERDDDIKKKEKRKQYAAAIFMLYMCLSSITVDKFIIFSSKFFFLNRITSTWHYLLYRLKLKQIYSILYVFKTNSVVAVLLLISMKKIYGTMLYFIVVAIFWKEYKKYIHEFEEKRLEIEPFVQTRIVFCI